MAGRPKSTELGTLSPQRWRRTAAFAWQGLQHAYRTQPNFRMEVWITPLVLLAGLALRLPQAQLLAVALCCLLVMGLELLNTAIEAVVDLVSPAFHPLAKVAKDAAAAAVLLAVIGSALIGVWVFGTALLRL